MLEVIKTIDVAMKGLDAIKESEHNMQLANSISALANAKIKIVSLNQEKEELKRKLEKREQTHWEEPYYFVVNDKREKEGPYCQLCYDDHKKYIRLQKGEFMGGNWSCNKCNQVYADKNHTPNSSSFSTETLDYDPLEHRF